MKRRRILLVLAVAAVAAGLVLFWPRGPKEPVYQGKRFSEWIEEAQISDSSPDRKKAEEAIRAIRSVGTNALPWLVFEFTRSRSKWRTSFNKLATGRLPDRFRFAEDHEKRSAVATAGFYVLGPASAPALPELAAYLGDDHIGSWTADVMSFCGEPAVPFLRAAMASANPQAAAAAVRGLSYLAITNDAVIPPIVALTSHTNDVVRFWAVFSLGCGQSQPDVIVPVLTRALSDAMANVRIRAAFNLSQFEGNAKPALPELLWMMTNSNPAVAAAASNAVFHIDPAAMPRCEP